MGMSDALLPEFDHEMATTRTALERVPEDKFGWKPHEKSMTFGRLASHLAEIPMWGFMTMDRTELDLAPPGAPPYQPKALTSRDEILAMFDKNVADARAALVKAADSDYMTSWSLLKGGQTLMTMPRIAVLRSFVLNHTVHHRAQLGVFLRLNELSVPSTYGPSADEGMM